MVRKGRGEGKPQFPEGRLRNLAQPFVFPGGPGAPYHGLLLQDPAVRSPRATLREKIGQWRAKHGWAGRSLARLLEHIIL